MLFSKSALIAAAPNAPRVLEGGAMAIVRFDPFREISNMQDRINRIFGDVYRRTDDDVLSRGDWLPPVDIYENDRHEIVLRAELPGLNREEIDIRVENNNLTLRGERKRDAEVKEENYHRVERSYGGFSRSFALPTTVDTEKVSASFTDGVLTITLPLREEAKPRQIQVQVH
jgi:HSP20 family protein